MEFWGTPYGFRMFCTDHWADRLANLELRSCSMPAGGISFWACSDHDCRSWVWGYPQPFGVPQREFWGTPYGFRLFLTIHWTNRFQNLELRSCSMPAGCISFLACFRHDYESWVLGYPKWFWGTPYGFRMFHTIHWTDRSETWMVDSHSMPADGISFWACSARK
jgi:hypothetical protein